MDASNQPPEGRNAGARRLFGHAVALGFTETALHPYCTADGAELFTVARMKHPTWRELPDTVREGILAKLGHLAPGTGGKIVRSMHRPGTRYVGKRPQQPPEGWPLYRLPELLAADPSAPVFVVEGEKCADALHRLGLTAVTSGGATSDDNADWQPLAGRRVILWPDHDDDGRKYAEHVGARLRGLQTACEWIDVAALGLPEKGDCVDWIKAHPEATAADVLALPRAVQATTEGTQPVEGPEPLRRSTGAAEAFPVKALGAVLGPAVEAVHEYVQAPLALCAQSALAVASLVAQRLYSAENDGREHPLSLWLLTVAESGERKSAADGVLCREVKEWERVQYAAYRIERDAYQREAEAFAKQEAKAAKVGLAAVEPPPPPLEATVITGEPTLEGLHKLLLRNRGWAGLLSDEGGQFIGGHAMSRDNIGKTVAGLSGLWDNGTADRVRGGDGVSKLYGKRVSLHLMMQPVFAEELLSNPKASGQGFLARCLFAWPASTAGHRPYRTGDVQADTRLRTFHGRIAALLNVPEPMREGERNELEPRRLPLADDAKAYWIRAHDAIEVRQQAGGEYETIKPWASKAPEQVLRIAGVLAVMDRDHPTAIRLPEVQAAAELVNWYLAEALRLRGVASIPQEIRDAETVLAWCRERGLSTVHSAELVRLGPAAIRTSDAVHAAMAVLERHNWAQRIEGGAVLDGKHRRHAWTIAPEPEG